MSTRLGRKGKHGSSISKKELRHASLRLSSIPGVNKIVLGHSRRLRHTRPPGTVRVRYVVRGGVKIVLYDQDGIVEAYLLSARADRQGIADEVRRRFGPN